MLRNPEELEYKYQQAYIMINCEDGAQEYVMEELKSIKCIKEMTTTVGPYDIVTKIAVPSIDALRETIEFKIRRIQRVRTTTTIICEQSKSFLNSIKGKMYHV
ncbi:MAG: Lrp/AsnC family transcriptional regulator [Thaumarchaeota archaeon]|nr:Lrp/AsnC family transcriptional regulator [Nitrososphaerota archaeon]MBI3641505.1 Lrp/AsnC family transcriptional regulator [Nitrososphaerota archaeon]